MADLFLDTSFAVALAVPSDAHAEASAYWSRLVQQRGDALVTTTGVVLEIGNGLASVNRRRAATRLIDLLYRDPAIRVVEIDTSLVDRARDPYRSRPDKAWGLVDCASFVVMRERGIAGALTADRHFEQAGFRALLHEAP